MKLKTVNGIVIQKTKEDLKLEEENLNFRYNVWKRYGKGDFNTHKYSIRDFEKPEDNIFLPNCRNS